MEEMDIEQVVDIPDTPDRLTARHINGAKSGKESNSSAPGPSRTDFRDKECLNQPRARSSENGHLNPQRISVKMDGFVPRNKSITFAPSENSCRSKNAPLFRRGAMAYNSKPETRLSIGTQHLDKGKPESTKVPLRSRVHMEEEAIFDMAFPCRGSKTLQAEQTRDVQVSPSGGSNLRYAPMTSSNSCKGKEKIGVNACNGSGLTLNDGKGIGPTGGSQPKIEKQLCASALPVISPRVTGQKRLVRNGCISPHNIATSTKKLAESHQVGSTNVEKDHVISMVSGGPSEVDIREIVAEENNCHRAKGKGVVFHPSTSTEHNVKIGHASTSCGTNNKAANETSDVSRDSLLGGWRSTLNRTKNIYQMEVEDECFIDEQRRDRVVRRNNGNGNVTKITSDSGDHGEGQTASRPVSGLNQTSQSHHIGNVHSKRQRKHRLTSRNQSDSTTVPDDSEIFFLGSSEESSNSRSSRTLNRQHQGMLGPSYEIDELLPERRNNSSPGLGSMNDESDSRARQVEADEMLARELQEQLYHEAPVYGGSEIDENIAWVLQQEEDAFRTASSQNRPRLRLRNSATVNANRQPQPQSFQNPSNRRRAQTQVPTGRTSLRNRLLNRSTAALPRARNHSHTALSRASSLQFPLGMDLDMRIDILEALEDAVGEFSDMSMTASRILHVQRDFNENDYEMLLALDENNHQPGASVNRINSLPESVVQTENFEETCAICLETPTIGETIRHLPCLHKFHKDCIDPWLGRKTSCPVCKSSIT